MRPEIGGTASGSIFCTGTAWNGWNAIRRNASSHAGFGGKIGGTRSGTLPPFRSFSFSLEKDGTRRGVWKGKRQATSVALLFHGYTERAGEARKDAVRKVGRGRKAAQEPDEIGRVEINPTYEKPAERTREKVQKEAGVSEHKARQALRVVEGSGSPGNFGSFGRFGARSPGRGAPMPSGAACP